MQAPLISPMLLSDQLAKEQRFQLRPLWVYLIGSVASWLTELRKTLMFTSLLNHVIRDTDAQPGEEARRARTFCS